MNNKKIVYIAGYSRSGSTILDIILGSHQNMFGTGELTYLFDDWLHAERLCTCGNTYTKCEFWKHFKLPEEMSFEEAIKIIRQVESRSGLSLLVNGKIPANIIEKYRQIQSALYNYITETAQKDIVVDSSKSSRDMAGRFYALSKYTDYEVYVIHLVRSGLSVVESFVKNGSNWALEGYKKPERFIAARSSFGWFLANSIARRIGMKMPAKHYMQIKYEDLTNQPENVLISIGEFLNEDLSEAISTIQKESLFHPGHNVGGNRLRLEKGIRFRKSPASEARLSVFHRLIYNLIAGRLHKKLGY